MDTTETEEEQPIDAQTRAALAALDAEARETSAMVSAIAADTKSAMAQILSDVDTTITEIDTITQELDQADTEAGDALDLLMMQTAEDLASG